MLYRPLLFCNSFKIPYQLVIFMFLLIYYFNFNTLRIPVSGEEIFNVIFLILIGNIVCPLIRNKTNFYHDKKEVADIVNLC